MDVGVAVPAGNGGVRPVHLGELVFEASVLGLHGPFGSAVGRTYAENICLSIPIPVPGEYERRKCLI